MHVLEAALFANLMESPGRTPGSELVFESQLGRTPDKRQYDELIAIMHETGALPFGTRKMSWLTRLRLWLAGGEPAALRNVACQAAGDALPRPAGSR
jgi:hypothetical protein